jgi:hypothetical protein
MIALFVYDSRWVHGVAQVAVVMYFLHSTPGFIFIYTGRIELYMGI